MPFCFECGLEVNPAWKFCPNCKASLVNEKTQNQAIFTQKDSVIVGDVTINQQSSNFNSQILICENCGSEGNITLRPCIRQECSIKSCEECLDRYDGNCSPQCHSKSKSEAREMKRIKDEQNRIIQERALERKRIIDEQNLKNRERMERKRKLAQEAHQKQQNEKFTKAAVFFAIPAIIMLGFSYYSFQIVDADALDYTCGSGEHIEGWEVLDGNSDCSDGSDEMDTETNQEHKQWVEKQNDTMQPNERNGALSCCGFFIFGLIFLLTASDY